MAEDKIGGAVSHDFAMRVIPTFSFKPERAEDLDAHDRRDFRCENCNTWTLDIHDGHLTPAATALRTPRFTSRPTPGFFSFIRGEQPAELVGGAHRPFPRRPSASRAVANA